MLRNFKNIIFLFLILTSIFFTINYYLSEKNIIHVNKSRSFYSMSEYNDLPLLKNDTSNIIFYKNDLEEFKKKRKKRFWEKLISDED